MTFVAERFGSFKFGCDPELFVADENGKFVCADGLIPGTKDEPYKVEYGAVQVDGMAAEFNIDPATCYEEWENNIVAVLKQLKAFLPKGYSLVPVPSVTFTQDVWESAPTDAKVLGCSPDFNAWTGGVNPPPEDVENPTLRTASGHIHIGWTDDADVTNMKHIKHCQDLVRQLDWFLGAWSLSKDEDPVRRRLYGKAGACRYKPYGVEYRVLSNFWLTSKPLRREVWNRLQQALHEMRSNFLPDRGYEDLLIRSIDNSQRDAYLEKAFRYPIRYI